MLAETCGIRGKAAIRDNCSIRHVERIFLPKLRVLCHYSDQNIELRRPEIKCSLADPVEISRKKGLLEPDRVVPMKVSV